MSAPSIRRAPRRRLDRQERILSLSVTGCPFAGRCAWQLGRLCEEKLPPWREITAKHRIRCHIDAPGLVDRAKRDLTHLYERAAASP